MATYTGPICWKCEKPIVSGLFGYTFKTSTGDASSCKKCATHHRRVIGYEKHKLGLIPIVEQYAIY